MYKEVNWRSAPARDEKGEVGRKRHGGLPSSVLQAVRTRATWRCTSGSTSQHWRELAEGVKKRMEGAATRGKDYRVMAQGNFD